MVRFASHLSAIPGVTVDQGEAAAEMIRYLIGLGHRRVGVITGPQRVRAAAERLEGYHRAIKAAGLEDDPDLVVEGSFTSESGATAIRELLQRAPDVTAVATANDVTALGALRMLGEAGIRVPRDVSVAGFNDIRLCRYVSPSLTTVHVPIREQAEQVFQLFLDGLEGRPQESRELPTHIVERESTGPPRREEAVSTGQLDQLQAATSARDELWATS